MLGSPCLLTQPMDLLVDKCQQSTGSDCTLCYGANIEARAARDGVCRQKWSMSRPAHDCNGCLLGDWHTLGRQRHWRLILHFYLHRHLRFERSDIVTCRFQRSEDSHLQKWYAGGDNGSCFTDVFCAANSLIEHAQVLDGKHSITEWLATGGGGGGGFS